MEYHKEHSSWYWLQLGGSGKNRRKNSIIQQKDEERAEFKMLLTQDLRHIILLCLFSPCIFITLFNVMIHFFLYSLYIHFFPVVSSWPQIFPVRFTCNFLPPPPGLFWFLISSKTLNCTKRLAPLLLISHCFSNIDFILILRKHDSVCDCDHVLIQRFAQVSLC